MTLRSASILFPWPGIWVVPGPMLQPGVNLVEKTKKESPMNILTIVLLSLSGAVQAIGLAEGFVTNQQVKTVLDDVRQAIQGAIGALQPHQRAEQEASRTGAPVTAEKPAESQSK